MMHILVQPIHAILVLQTDARRCETRLHTHSSSQEPSGCWPEGSSTLFFSLL